MEQRKSRGKVDVEPAVLDVRGLREFLGRTVGLSTLYKAIREGKIPHRRLGARILISRRQLLAWLESEGSADTTGS